MDDPIPTALSQTQQQTKRRTHHLFSVENVAKLYPSHVLDLDVADLKKSKLALPLTLLYLVIFSAILSFTFSSTYFSSIGKQFLSLDETNDFQTCSRELQTVSGSFSGDYLGRWSNDRSFTLNNSVYQLFFEGSIISQEQYVGSMKQFSAKLETLGKKSAQRDFIWSAIAWSTYSAQDSETRMTLITNADPAIILEGSSISQPNMEAACDLTASATFSTDVTKLNIEYDIEWPVRGWSNIKILRDHVFKETPLSHTPGVTTCNDVCEALPAKNNVPFVCKSGPTVLTKSNYNQNPGLSSLCSKGMSSNYLTDLGVGGAPFVSIGGSCYLPDTSVLSCDTRTERELPSHLKMIISSIRKPLPAVNVSTICPCAPAYVEPCPKLFNISQSFQWNVFAAPDPTLFSMRFDTRSLFLATAVNFGMVSLENLQKVTHKGVDQRFRTWSNRQDYPSINFYILPTFGPMTPIVCVDKAWIDALKTGFAVSGNPQYCLVANNGVGPQTRILLAFPIIANAHEIFKECLCANGGRDKVQCNGLQIDINLLFSRDQNSYTPLLIEGLKLASLLQTDEQNGDLTMVNKIYDHIAYQKQFGVPFSDDAFMLSYTLQKNELTQFLDINQYGLDFSLVSESTFTVGDGNMFAGTVLPTITCTNTIFQKIAMQRMIAQPPMNLTYPYYKCHSTKESAIVASFGSAAGTTSLLASGAFGLLGIFLVTACSAVMKRRVRFTRESVAERFERIEELIECITEVSILGGKSKAFAKLLRVYEQIKADEDLLDARASQFDLSTAYSDAASSSLEMRPISVGAGRRLIPVSPVVLNPVK